MYAKHIDNVRKVVAASFAVCGLGFAAALNVGSESAAGALGIGALLSLFSAFGLFVEYLVRARMEAQSTRGAAYQFTLAELMQLMVVVAIVLGVFRVLGWYTVGAVILAIL